MVYRKSMIILGSNGFIGNNLLNDLGGIGITKENYAGQDCDVLINANGNSRKLLPETDPLTDFDLTVRNTMKSIMDFHFNIYIYVSSCEVYGDLSLKENTKEETNIDIFNVSRYGLSKYLAECIVKKYCKKWIILRLNGPIGPNMKKGPVYDISN